jgi:ATP-dependent Clp endopeptidase proteolytic subunit ClpP
MAQDEKIPVFSERTRLSLQQRRVLVLDGVLDDDNGTLLATQLLTLADEDADADIALWINSPGGSVPSMLAIRDVMRLIPCDIATLALGIACSAGQFLLSAGTKGKRFAIDPGVANTLTAQLIYLEARSPDEEINLYINCEGGDMNSMLAVYDTMRFIQAPVATTCVGQAIAAGAVLLAGGSAGRRSILPHARVVLHQPAARGQGAIPDLILQADEVVRQRADMEAVLSLHTGQSVQTLRTDTDRLFSG